MCNSGTEATMSSIRLGPWIHGTLKDHQIRRLLPRTCRQLAGKGRIRSPHLGNPDSAGIPESFAKETIVLPYNDLGAVADAFAQSAENIAGIIVEPYPANCGLILPEEGYLEGLRKICTDNGSVLIFDEVMTGFRLGIGGVQERTGVTPDLTAMGKIIGGGLPVGAFGGKSEIMDCLAPLGPVYQAGTLSGNPLAMAAGIASLRMLKENPPYDRLEKLGAMLAMGIKEAAEEKGVALQVPQAGSMFCLFFSGSPVRNFDEALNSDRRSLQENFPCLSASGIYLPPSAYETCFISSAHGEEEISQTIDKVRMALS